MRDSDNRLFAPETANLAQVDELRALSGLGASVLLLHQRPKPPDITYRGSTEIPVAVDIAIAASLDSGLPDVQMFKNRFGSEYSFCVRPDLDAGGSFVLVNSPRLSADNDLIDRLLSVIRERPGITETELLKAAEAPRHRGRQVLIRHAGKKWQAEPGPNNSTCYSPIDGFLKNRKTEPVEAEVIQ